MVMAYQAQSDIFLAIGSPFKLFTAPLSLYLLCVRMNKLLKDIIYFFTCVLICTKKSPRDERKDKLISIRRYYPKSNSEDRSPI